MNKPHYIILPFLFQCTLPVFAMDDSLSENNSFYSWGDHFNLSDTSNISDLTAAYASYIGTFGAPTVRESFSTQRTSSDGRSSAYLDDEDSSDSAISLKRRPKTNLNKKYCGTNSLNNRSVSSSESILIFEELPFPQGRNDEMVKEIVKDILLESWKIAKTRRLVSKILKPSKNKKTIFKKALKKEYRRILNESAQTLSDEKMVEFSSVTLSTAITACSFSLSIALGFTQTTAICGLLSGVLVSCGLPAMINKRKMQNAHVIQYLNKYDNFKETLFDQTFGRYKNVLNFFTEESVKSLAVVAMQQMAYYAHEPSQVVTTQLLSKLSNAQTSPNNQQQLNKNWQDLLESVLNKESNSNATEAAAQWAVRFFMNGLLRKPFYHTHKKRFNYTLNDPYEIVRIFVTKQNRYGQLVTVTGDLINPFIVIAGQAPLYKIPGDGYKKFQPLNNFMEHFSFGKKAKTLRKIARFYFEQGKINDSNQRAIMKQLFFMATGYETNYDQDFQKDPASGNGSLLSWDLLKIYNERKIDLEEIEYI